MFVFIVYTVALIETFYLDPGLFLINRRRLVIKQQEAEKIENN